jgi:tRNA threonylcarbamoyl adenosine modification protein YjeE
MADTFLTLALPDEAATIALAEDVGACLTPGDTVALSGGLGVGKTTFARALIRALAGDPVLEVPSPTFTLVQTYPLDRLTVAHIDLYRLSEAAEIDEIGLADALATGAALIEWPERAADRLPEDRLDIALDIAGTGRHAMLSGSADWQARIERSRASRAFLDRSAFAGANRRPITGDASTRRYERVRTGASRAVLMDWPPSDAAPVGDRRFRYRAHDVGAFIAVDEALRAAGFSAPAIYAADVAAGFALMEDFGDEGIVHDGAPVVERYRAAIEVLAAIHTTPRPAALPAPAGALHRLPALSAAAMTPEIDLFVDWYVPHATGLPLVDDALAGLAHLWSPLFDRLAAYERSWVLFDVQSANLLWLVDRPRLKRIGFIDFQDMFFGPAAYDVASLCQDARVTIPATLEDEFRGHYVALRRAADPRFDAEAFFTAYAILSTLRGLKNLGVFARQADHLGQSRYLRHIPRVREYLVRNLAHPVLSDLAVWYGKHLPPSAGP